MINRTEGEYPFYPGRPEHEVFSQPKAVLIADEETGEERWVIDYSPSREKTGFLVGGDSISIKFQ